MALKDELKKIRKERRERKLENKVGVSLELEAQSIEKRLSKELRGEVVKEVKKGNDAGITYEGDVIIEDGDVLHFYKKELIKRKL